LNDWPDRYIHTNFDSAANIDPTKLKRAAFIGAASAYFLAGLTGSSAKEVSEKVPLRSLVYLDQREQRAAQLRGEAANVIHRGFETYRVSALQSVSRFSQGGPLKIDEIAHISHDFSAGLPPKPATPDGRLIYKRKTNVLGPLAVFGYDYFADHAKAPGIETPKLLNYEGLWGGGEEYAYEVLNFADGKRNAQEIRDAGSAEYGPVPLEMVVEYLKALEKIGIVEAVKQ